MHTKTGDMFLPPLGGNELLEDKRFQFGGKFWGDFTGFHQMNVEVLTEQVVRHLKCELDPVLREQENSDFLNSPIATVVPIEAKPRAPSGHGLTKAMLDELLFYSMPSLLPFTEELIVRFGGVHRRDNFQTVWNREAALREIVAAIILTSRGTVVDKANLLFDLFGHHDPAKPNVGRFCEAYDFDPYRIGPDAARTGEKLELFLPDGAMKSIVKDETTRPNCISLAECTALVQTILLRFLVHIDNVQAFHMASLLFDPVGNVPRVLKATIRTISEKSHQKTHDVTGPFLRFVARECGETGLYGINFTRHLNLKSIKIKDPFPRVHKELVLVISRDGSMDTIDVVTVEINESGELRSGRGGNYENSLNQVRCENELPRHLRKMGTFSKCQLDILSNHPLSAACYMFDFHCAVIDKFSFVSRFVACDILTEPLRRVTAFERWLTPRTEMSLDVKLDIPIDLMTLNNTDFPGHYGKSVVDTQLMKDTCSYGPSIRMSPVAVHGAVSSINHSQRCIECVRDSIVSLPFTKQFWTAANHAAELHRDRGVPAFIKVTISRARSLLDVRGHGKQDPYCTFEIGPLPSID